MYRIYIAENTEQDSMVNESSPIESVPETSASPSDKVLDTVGVEPIQSVQTQTKEVTEPVSAQVSEQNTPLMMCLLILICILISILFYFYAKLKKMNDMQNARIASSKNNFKKIIEDEREREQEEKDEIKNQIIKVKNQEKSRITENNNEIHTQIGTPNNVALCIKNFLEITKDK